MKRKVEHLLSKFSKKKKAAVENYEEFNELKFSSLLCTESGDLLPSSANCLHDPKIILQVMKYLDMGEILFNCCNSGESSNSSMDINPLYLVCKSWFNTIQSEEFSRNYLLIYHNLVKNSRM